MTLYLLPGKAFFNAAASAWVSLDTLPWRASAGISIFSSIFQLIKSLDVDIPYLSAIG
jgi:hypothetical protein